MIEVEGDTLRPQHLFEEEEVALGVLLLAEERCYDRSCSIVNRAQEGATRLVWAKPVMGAAVYLQEHAFLGHPLATLAMSRRPVAVRCLEAGCAPDALDALATEDDAFSLGQELGQVVVVAAGVGTGKQLYHPRADLLLDPPGRSLTAVAMHKGRRPSCR